MFFWQIIHLPSRLMPKQLSKIFDTKAKALCIKLTEMPKPAYNKSCYYNSAMAAQSECH